MMMSQFSLKFSTTQKVCTIGDVEIGGQPGERPSVLIGSIFFAGHGIVRDPVKGIFDNSAARALLDREADISKATGIPRVVDVIGETPEALIRYIEFVAENTSSPILLDSPSQETRLAAVRHFAGSKIMPRLIYNAIAEDYTGAELDCLKDNGVNHAIVLAFSTRAMKPRAKIKMLDDYLLPAARRAGVKNILIDMGVMDVPSISWISLAINEAKEKLGHPSGCAPANAIYTWTKMKARGTAAFQAAAASVFSMPRLLGADFLFYGSLRNASWIYPAIAAIDGLTAYAGRFTGVSVTTENHPLYKVF